MTIGIGFKCSDGIVLATDTQYTRGPLKSHGPKIFPIIGSGDGRNDLSAVVAGAGNVPFMKRAAEKITDALKQLVSPSMNDIRIMTEDTLSVFYRDHIYPQPHFQETGVGFTLLMGIWTERDGFEIFKTADATMAPVRPYGCIGAGIYVSEYAIDLVFDPGLGLTVDEAKFLATFSIKAAKDYVNGCGGSTKIYTLKLDEAGICRTTVTSDISVQFREKQSSGIYETVKLLLKVMDVDGASDDDAVGLFTDYIKDVVLDFRKKQREQKESFKRRQEARKAKQPTLPPS